VTLSVLNRNRGAWDPNAATYIAAVEAADGQSLEISVKRAINRFVITCKNNGIWNGIQSCCLLCGARTLSGALVPLKGTAPTNVNFTISDYNRETGIVGDGGSKYLLSNRLESADPQDNKHLSIFIAGASPSSIACGLIGVGSSNGSLIGSNSNGLQLMINSTSYAQINNTYPSGFIGVSRNNSSTLYVRLNKNTQVISSNSTNTGRTQNIGILGSISGLSNATSRASFYSIGSSINLASLDSAISRFMLDIDQALNYQPLDYDASTYIKAVEIADGDHLEYSLRQAIDNFVMGCKSDGVWSSMGSCGILCGAKTLSGCLVPLKGPNPINFNFLSSDYTRKGNSLGLQGNTTNKYINTNRLASIDNQNNFSFGVYINAAPSINGGQAISNGGGGSAGSSAIVPSTYPGGTLSVFNRSVTSDDLGAKSPFAGFYGSSRNNSTNYVVRSLSSDSTITRTSEAISAGNWFLFSRGDAGWFDGKIAFYFTGAYLTLSLLESRINTLINIIKNL